MKNPSKAKMAMIRRQLLFAATGWLILLPSLGYAQRAGDGFLFREPRVQAGIRFAHAGASADSEIFDFSREQLTLDKRDFSAGAVGVDVALWISERVDVAFGLSSASASKRSEFRDWVGDDDLPIEQETTFMRRPFTVSARYFLDDRGRSVSRFAWVPNGVTTYVGGGIGIMWYEFVQEGEFVDFVDLVIFESRFKSSGWSWMTHVSGGVEIGFGSRFILSVEGRYERASARLQQDFIGFDDIDLSGFQVSTGLSVRF